MAYIFLDESGDLGFSEKSSKWFIVTIALTGNKRKIEKSIKRVHLSLRKKYKKMGELHAYHSNDATKRKILHSLSLLEDLEVICIILNKEKVYVDLQNQKNYLYNYTVNILFDRLSNRKIFGSTDKINICIDQRHTNKFLRNNFEKYLRDNLVKKINNFEITIKPSHAEKCLQAVDFISWVIFRKYEMGDDAYHKIIKDKIIEENMLFT